MQSAISRIWGATKNLTLFGAPNANNTDTNPKTDLNASLSIISHDEMLSVSEISLDITSTDIKVRASQPNLTPSPVEVPQIPAVTTKEPYPLN
jgi:hypothetical protein